MEEMLISYGPGRYCSVYFLWNGMFIQMGWVLKVLLRSNCANLNLFMHCLWERRISLAGIIGFCHEYFRIFVFCFGILSVLGFLDGYVSSFEINFIFGNV